MVCELGVEFTVQQVQRVVRDGVPGSLVECGVWRGGCSIAMGLAGPDRALHMFDSFKGLPPVEEADGADAARWQDSSLDNCEASREEVEKNLSRHRVKARIHEGQFDRTMPWFPREPIALLRLDCDWHRSVGTCLEYLAPLVSPGGCVIIDDYYAWDGCARAVHKYLFMRDLPYRLRTAGDGDLAYYMVP